MKLLKKVNKIFISIIIISIVCLLIVPINNSHAATKYTQSLKSGISNFPKEYPTY